MDIPVVLGGVALAAVVGLAAVELALRVTGVTSFPIYRIDEELGYIPAPSQKGRLLRRYDWAFNDRSMVGDRDFEPSEKSVLLVGDSVVLGQARLAASERLGATLEGLLRVPVWSISAGSWALENELKWLMGNREIWPDIIVIIANGGDLNKASKWKNELTHPRRRPLLACLYLTTKKFFSPPAPAIYPPAREEIESWGGLLDAFFAAKPQRALFVIYPLKSRNDDELEALRTLRDAIGDRAEILDLSLSPQWGSTCYADSIHPNVSGNQVLARVVADSIGGA